MSSAGFLDVSTATSYVSSIMSDTASQAASSFQTALNNINALGNGITIAAPTITLPVSPDAATQQDMPDAPNINIPSMGTVTAPTAPTLETLDLPDIEIPDFDATAPTVSIPDVPDVATPDDPGDAPSIDDVVIPNAPDLDIPTAPVLDDVVLPSWDALSLPEFAGARPNDVTFEAPGQLFTYQEGSFSSTLQDAIEQQIYDDLLSGGNIDAITGITEAIAKAESVAARTLRIELAAIRDGWAARGQDGPTGADEDKEYQARQRYSDSVNEVTAQFVTERCRLTVQHREALLQHGLSFVDLRFRAYSEAQNRALEAAKATADFGYRNVEIQVQIYNLQLSRYQADAAVFEAKVRASSQILDARRLELETARLRGDLRKQDIDIYVAKCSALSVSIESYKAQIQGALAKLQAQTEKINAFRAKVDAFVAQINSMTAQYNAWGTRVSAEKVKVDLYATQAQAYNYRVSGKKVVADIGATQAGIVDSRNKGNISLYQSSLEATKVELQRLIAEVDTAVKQTASQVQVYDATVRGVAAQNESTRGLAALNLQEWSSRLTATIQQAQLALDYAKAQGSLSETAIAAAASTSAQLAASALGSRHASANVGFSGSNSNSNSFNTSYNYSSSQSASV